MDQIDYVISSHGHSDHTGNNNLFIENVKQHIVGFCINFKDQYYAHPFEHGMTVDNCEYVNTWMLKKEIYLMYTHILSLFS